MSSMFLIPKNHKESFVVSENGKQICGHIKQFSAFHIPFILDVLSPSSSEQ